MVATLYRQRNNKQETVEAITAEDKWQDIIDLWLLMETPPLPSGKYIITEADSMGVVQLDLTDSGEPCLKLLSWMNTNFLTIKKDGD